MDNLKLICSLATWRTLRKENKTQYDVIAIFCKNIIAHYYPSFSFSLHDISRKIEEEYGFKILDSILAEVLSNNLKEYLKENKLSNTYISKKSIIINQELKQTINAYIKEYEDFSDNLKIFLNKKMKECPKNILELFNEFILDKEIDKKESRSFLAYFSEFLLLNEKKYSHLLQTIKEGVILYEGLQYKITKPRQKTQLILFLDVEILFHAMGYNGEQYKKKFDDFYKLVLQYDEGNLLMPLYYSEITKKEIKDFFYKAQDIKKRKVADYKSTVAMDYLMKNFQDFTAIESEETKFFYDLKKNFNIQEYKKYKYDELLKEDSKFNLESLSALKNIKQELEVKIKSENNIDEKIINSIQILSFINMMRREYPKHLFESKILLITNRYITNYIAWHKDIMEEKTIPLSNHLDFITARLWEFLEISLGQSIKLSTQNPIFSLQIILKEILSDTLNKQYIKAREDYEKYNDKELFAQEILDIQDKMKLEPNIENIGYFEEILSFDEVEEEKR